MNNLTEREIGMYYGCLAKLDHIESPVIVKGVRNGQVLCQYTNDEEKNKQHWRSIEEDNIKLLLRELSDITGGEAIELTKPIIVYGDHPDTRVYDVYVNAFRKLVVSWGESHLEKYVPQDETIWHPKQFDFLLKQGFDVFGHIGSGKSIKTSIMKGVPQQ